MVDDTPALLEKTVSPPTVHTLYCSFCGKSQHEVQKLVAGPTVFICDECIVLCLEIVIEDGVALFQKILLRLLLGIPLKEGGCSEITATELIENALALGPPATLESLSVEELIFRVAGVIAPGRKHDALEIQLTKVELSIRRSREALAADERKRRVILGALKKK